MIQYIMQYLIGGFQTTTIFANEDFAKYLQQNAN